MGIVSGLLTLPVLGAPRLLLWLAGAIASEVERQATDEGSLRGALMQLQELFDAGELDAGEYDRQEEALLERLRQAMALKSERR